MRTDWLGAPAERPATRLRETIEAVRAVWTSAQAGRGATTRASWCSSTCAPTAGPDQVRDDDPGLRGGGQRGDGPHRRAPSRTASSAHPMATAALHRRGDAAGDRRGRAARGPRRRRRGGGGLGDRGRVRRRANRRARTPSARSPSTPPCAPTTGSSSCTGSTTSPPQIRELWQSFDLAGMTALVTDEMLDEMAVAGTRRRVPRGARRARARARIACCSARRSWRPIPARIRDYHDAIVETFGAADRTPRRAALRALDCRPPGWEGWTLFYMVVILKIPMVAALWLVWWAIKQEPEPEEAPARTAARAASCPPLPRWPRRGPAAAAAPAARPPPCPQTTSVRAHRAPGAGLRAPRGVDGRSSRADPRRIGAGSTAGPRASRGASRPCASRAGARCRRSSCRIRAARPTSS